MVVRHSPILKAKAGEFQALVNARDDIADRTLPLFEISRLPEATLMPKYLLTSSSRTITYLNRIAESICESWAGRSAMIDGDYWPPNARTETGEHIIRELYV